MDYGHYLVKYLNLSQDNILPKNTIINTPDYIFIGNHSVCIGIVYIKESGDIKFIGEDDGNWFNNDSNLHSYQINAVSALFRILYDDFHFKISEKKRIKKARKKYK